jgi:fibronectin type 3 domain-containing protein
LNPNQSATLNVTFDPTTAGSATGQVTITSNATSGSTTTVSLSGTGQSVSHSVNLTWSAPSSSPDPVVGYNIYRAASGSSTYQQINSSTNAQTTYQDNNVQSGQSFSYYVVSVDGSGTASTPSNTATATIP